MISKDFRGGLPLTRLPGASEVNSEDWGVLEAWDWSTSWVLEAWAQEGCGSELRGWGVLEAPCDARLPGRASGGLPGGNSEDES